MKCEKRLDGEKACGAPAAEFVMGQWRCNAHLPDDSPQGACSHSLGSNGRCAFCGAKTPEWAEFPINGTDQPVLIDVADLPTIQSSPTCWRLVNGYARTERTINRRKTVIYMHRLVLGVTAGEVDHANRNKLDNRRWNLRRAERWQQVANTGLRSNNTTGFKGVSRRGQRWQAGIRTAGRRRWLGEFDDPTDAARAYDAAAFELFGPFAVVNFPERAA